MPATVRARSPRAFRRIALPLAVGLAALVTLAGCATAPPANTPATVRVNLFRGASNIPIYMALERGEFARRGLAVQMQFTPNSDEQRAGLPAGRFEIAHSAVDNAVAVIEVAKADAVIVAGGDGGMNEVLVRADVKAPADMRGKSYVVDAPNTAYALIGRKILKNAGLVEGRDYTLDPLGGSEGRSRFLDAPNGAMTLLNPPWNFIAKDRGAVALGRTVDLYGAYQAQGAFVMRSWAEANAGTLERYLAAFIAGCRAAQDPANRAQVLAVLRRELKLNERIAELTYAELMTKGHGLAPDCAFDMTGFRNVLALRAEIEGQWGGKPPAPQKYLDLRWYERAKRHAGS